MRDKVIIYHMCKEFATEKQKIRKVIIRSYE